VANDPRSYVRSLRPFDALPQELFDEVAAQLGVSFHPAGTWLVRVGGEPLRHLHVIRKGVVRLEREGRTLRLCEEGETFGYASLITGKATLDVYVEEDLVAYRLPEPAFRRLLEDSRFSAHFALELTARLKASLTRTPFPSFRPDVSLALRQLIRRPAVWVEARASVGEAARVMTEQRVSSVLVRTEPPAIVTDRDLRDRVLAAGRASDTPVADVCSRPVHTVPAEVRLFEAWARLIDAGVHHLPVTRDGEIIGVVTSSDLLRVTSQGPMALLRRIEQLADRGALPGYAAQVVEMVAALLSGGLEATLIAGFVARLNDALVRRILGWAEAELGPAPAAYAWLAFGSEGRMEQTLLTDQDNALVYADEGAKRCDWFRALAARVNEDLERAGFPPCLGGHMARETSGTLSEWTGEFRSALETPHPCEAALYLDFRRVGGDLGIEPLESVVARVTGQALTLRFLAKEAMRFSPPSALVLRLKGKASSVDLKWQGIFPVVFLARCYGAEVGSRGLSTLDRLAAASRAGLMDEKLWASVSEAFRFLFGLRLRVQLARIVAGAPPTNSLTLTELTGHERGRLKESFSAIKVWQEKAAYHYQTNFL